MEAIACKIPCVGFNNGGVSEMISLCNAGLTCDADKEYNFDYVDLYNPQSQILSYKKSDF